MHRQPLLTLLSAHRPFDEAEASMIERTQRFVEEYADCFERTLACGHITGAAWVVDGSGTQILLMHHAKLDRWLQPGGHCDGDPDVARVACREAHEECGLETLQLVTPQIYDVDVHLIPSRGDIAAHYHYDVRFLLRADRSEPLRANSESKDLRWFSQAEVASFEEASLRRMVLKLLISNCRSSTPVRLSNPS